MDNICSCNSAIKDYLKKNIGKLVKIECLVAGQLQIKSGKLFDVNENYIILKIRQPLRTVMCDINSIVFATIIH